MDEGLKDDGADEAMRVLRDALAVEPSAGFEDRVRDAIAARADEPRSRRRWWMAAAAAAAIAAGVGLVARALRTEAPRATVEAVPPVTAPSAATGAPATPDVVRSAPAIPTAAIATAPRPRAIRTAPTSPFVGQARPLVPRGEAARVARYAAAVRRHPLQGPLLQVAEALTPLGQPERLAMAPLEITPIAHDEGSIR